MPSPLVFIPVVPAALFIATIVGVRLWFRGSDRYRECLRSIARLERELFPEWFKDEPVELPEHWSVAPGAVWRVSDPHAVSLHRAAIHQALLYGKTHASV